ncbi:MAG TPA: LuxR C-terminal-related transcriptional regulator [Myxococcota bacterium]|nr:LuxR C-terminal-related transcriptional regulator [Myxococcota bacterium]
MTKDAEPEAILEAIRAVGSGGRVIPEGLGEVGSSDAREPHERLSPREREIFQRILAHRSPGEIAAELDLTPSTVSTLLGRIKKKLGARTVPDLVGYAHRVGLVVAEVRQTGDA